MPLPLADYPPETGNEHVPGSGSGPAGYPDYPAPHGYQDLPGYPQDSYPADGYPPMSDYPLMSDYPATPDYPSMPDYPPAHGYRAAPATQSGYPATEYLPSGYPPAGYRPDGYPASGYPAEAYPATDQPPSGYPANGSPVAAAPVAAAPVAAAPAAGGRWVLEGAAVTHEEYVHHSDPSSSDPAGAAPDGAVPVAALVPEVPVQQAPVYEVLVHAAPATGSEDAKRAMLAYLTVPFFGFLVPLAIYLLSMRGSRWVRAHAAQAINLWLTGILYDLSAVIIGAVLVLDSPRVALAVVVPLIGVLWLTTLAFLVRAAAGASRGETYTFPRWLCTPMVR